MFDETKLAAENGTSSTIKIKDWLLLDCIGLLNIIPILGSIAALVLYLIIAFSSGTSPSMKNRVLASFIWMIIWLVIWFLFIFLFGGAAIIANLTSNM